MVIDGEKWRELCRTEGPDFGRTVKISSLVQQPATIEAGLRDALSRATTRTGATDETAPRVRVYSGHCLDYPVAERLAHSAFDGHNLARWFRAVCPGADMCLAFNEVDTWSATLADLLARELARPLADACGEPRAGLEWYSFIGRQGWTPFGLHSDPEPSMIFHLGPAPKEVWVFDPAELSRLPNGRQITFDYEKLLPIARHFVLQPGDFLVIPAFQFHIFRNIGYSAFLGLTVFPQDLRQETADIVMHLAPRPPAQPLAWAAAGEKIRSAARDLVTSRSFASDVSGALEDHESRLRSVAWTKRSVRMPDPVAWAEVASTAYAVSERPIAASHNGGALVVGGRMLKLPGGCDPADIATVLAPGRRIIGRDLIDELAALLPSEASARPLIAALEKCGGIRPEPEPA